MTKLESKLEPKWLRRKRTNFYVWDLFGGNTKQIYRFSDERDTQSVIFKGAFNL